MKETIVVLFGGQSSEHEVSCKSAANVIDQIDQDRYDLILIGITEEGKWILTPSVQEIRDDSWRQGKIGAVLSPDATEQCVILTYEDGHTEKKAVDLAFPVLHGLRGEDGTVQGLFELARLPYVGCGVLASAVGMDKLYTKIVVDTIGVRQAAYVPVLRPELADMEAVLDKVEAKLSYPVFVKPSNAGSSRGVSKAGNRGELRAALLLADAHDRKILVEETIIGHEIECAVFGGGRTEVQASGVGEVLAAAEFYDFDAKYNNAESRTVTDPVLPGDSAERVRQAARAIFTALDGYGLSRVDFFVTEKGEVIFNEINTLPGFTAISMYPMLWEARGISKKELVEKLIDHARERYHV